MGWRSLALVIAVCALGCGPVVDGDAEDSSSSDPSTTTPTPTTDDPPDPTVVDEATTTPSVLDVAAPEQNVSGTYLMAVSAVIDPQHPLQWIADVDHDTSTGELTITAQSLSLDVGSTSFPREPIGEPLVLQAGLGEDGRFAIETPQVMVPGPANPITGSDIVASLVIQGQVFGRELWCGDVFGEVTQPLSIDLQGSTFAFEPIPADGTLPDPVLWRCPD